MVRNQTEENLRIIGLEWLVNVGITILKQNNGINMLFYRSKPTWTTEILKCKEKGVDIINALFEDAEFRNAPRVFKVFSEDLDFLFKSSKMKYNHPDTLDFCKKLYFL